MRPSQPRRTAAANALAFFARLAIAFTIAPMLLRYLGDTRYGTWQLINGLTGYYGLLDIGVRSAVAFYVARLQAREEWAELEEVVRACFWLLATLGLAVTVVGIAVSFSLPSLFRLSPIPPNEAITASLIVSTMVGVNLPLSVAPAILNGVRRIDLVAGNELVVRSIAALIMVLAVRAGGNLVTLAAINAAATVASGALAWWQVRAVGAKTPLWPPRLDLPRLRDIFRLGSANLFVNVMVLLINNAQIVIIGAVLGTALVAPYSLGAQLVTHYHMMVATITMSFTTTFTHLHSSGQKDHLQSFFCTASRYTGALAAFVAAGLFFYGSPFLRLWVGDKYVTGDWHDRADVVLILLLIATLPRTFLSAGFQFLLSIRYMRFLMTLRGVEAAANIVLILLLIRPLGLAGVALGVLVPMALSHTGWMATHTLRMLDIGWGVYWRQVVRSSALLGVWAAVCALTISWLLPPHSWLNFCLGVLLTTVLCVPVLLMAVVSRSHLQVVLAHVNRLRFW